MEREQIVFCQDWADIADLGLQTKREIIILLLFTDVQIYLCFLFLRMQLLSCNEQPILKHVKQTGAEEAQYV